MATHLVAVRNDIANFVVDKLDAGSGNPNGQLIFCTGGSDEVATLELANPAFGAAAAGVAIAVISAFSIGAKSLYDDVQLNTQYRMENLELASRIEENHQILVRLEANQKFLLKKYDKDVK